MAKPRVCVLRAPGTNCDIETAHAFSLAGGDPERVHLFRLLENPAQFRDFHILCVPGGFSYGDDIGAGVVFAAQLQGHLAEAIGEFLTRDTLVLGICNGFQLLLKAGLLPDGQAGWPPAEPSRVTLTWNLNGRYTARWVHLESASSTNVFLRGIDRIELPIAHAEGRIALSDPSLPAQWHASGQLALAYCDPSVTTPYAPDAGILDAVHNPNGSVANIAGLGDPTGRILGLMPHPERFLFATQHPQWTRLRLTGEGAGLKLFRNAVEYFTA